VGQANSCFAQHGLGSIAISTVCGNRVSDTRLMNSIR
jgi:hypothetical protein